MELSTNFLQVIQDVVLHPNFLSAFALFFLAIVNEMASILPYALVLSSQLLFLQGPVSLTILIKLFLFIAMPVGIGAAIGSYLIYGLAYFGGKPAIEKFGKYFHLSWKDIEKVESKFQGSWYDEILFLVLRSIPLLPSFPVSIAAGILRMSPVPYFALTAIGFIIRMMIMFMFVGWGMEALVS